MFSSSGGPATGSLPFDITVHDPKERIQAYLDRYHADKEYAGFDALLMRSLRVVSAEAKENGREASVVFELQAVPGLCNPMGRLHGGAVALIADMTTTMATAPISKLDWWEFGGVTRTLGITMLAPIQRGTTIVIECMLRSIGKRLSATQCLMRDKETGRLLALGEHGKSALANQDNKASPSSKM